MMISEKMCKIFNFLSETNIVEEDFYNHIGDYPVYSGQTENQGIVGKIDIYNQKLPCVTFTTYGNAGKLFYREGKCTIGRNCMGLRPKDKHINQINLKWFTFSFQNLFYRLRIGDPLGQKSLNKLLLKRVLIEIPDITVQEKQLKKYERLSNLKKYINKVVNELMQTTNFYKTYPKDSIVAINKTKTFVNFTGGNSGLTEEFIYHNLPETEEDKIEILTSATLERTAMGFISKNAKPNNKKLKIFEGPAILVARNGYAGTMRYIPRDRFTTNDHAYVLTPKKAWKDKINLKWFISEYQQLFFNLVTSKSDNATFSKEYANRQIIKIPDIDLRNAFVRKIEHIESIITKLENIEKEIDELLEYTIV